MNKRNSIAIEKEFLSTNYINFGTSRGSVASGATTSAMSKIEKLQTKARLNAKNAVFGESGWKC